MPGPENCYSVPSKDTWGELRGSGIRELEQSGAIDAVLKDFRGSVPYADDGCAWAPPTSTAGIWPRCSRLRTLCAYTSTCTRPICQRQPPASRCGQRGLHPKPVQPRPRRPRLRGGGPEHRGRNPEAEPGCAARVPEIGSNEGTQGEGAANGSRLPLQLLVLMIMHTNANLKCLQSGEGFFCPARSRERGVAALR